MTWLNAIPSAVMTGARLLNELTIILIAAPAAIITGDSIAKAEAMVGNTGATITKAWAKPCSAKLRIVPIAVPTLTITLPTPCRIIAIPCPCIPIRAKAAPSAKIGTAKAAVLKPFETAQL